MKDNIFDNNANPFTVPDGYFDNLQERIMNRIGAEKNRAKNQGRIVRIHPYRWTLVAAAACVLFIFAGTTLYKAYTDKQAFVAETAIDEDFYRWFYASDEATLLAESLDVQIPEYFMTDETEYSEEDEVIILFFERDNISLAAIVYSLNNELLYTP